MPLLLNLTAVVLLLIAHCGSWTLASRLGPHKICPSCKDSRASRDPVGAANTAVLALGEPCGVYTLSCAKGLRCMPPPRDHSPLQALLQGRGICTKQIKTSPTEKPHPAGKSSLPFAGVRSSSMTSSESCCIIARRIRMNAVIRFKHTGI